jgi:RHS repeat-associated protein
VSYLHHDQAGSTRLITGSTGAVTGKCTYGAYGPPTCEGATTTPLGYDGQYTSSDTGLIYLQARVYDPAQDKKLTDQEIKELEEAGHHPHELKPGGSSEGLYRDREGNIYVKPKGGAGPGEPTGINLRGFRGC